MKLIQAATAATFLAALLAAGSAQAQSAAPAPAAPPAGQAPAAPQSPAQAQPRPQAQMPDPLTKEFHACSQKAIDDKLADDPGTAIACFKAETKRQEARISAGVTRLARLLNPSEKKRLDEANNGWRHFRDADCAFYADPAGVPPEAATNANCVLDRTIRRVLDLDNIARAYIERETERKGATPAAPAKK